MRVIGPPMHVLFNCPEPRNMLGTVNVSLLHCNVDPLLDKPRRGHRVVVVRANWSVTRGTTFGDSINVQTDGAFQEIEEQ